MAPVNIVFQSTLPAGGATADEDALICDMAISIHAPRGGSDVVCTDNRRRSPNFNPRSPRGERLRRTVLMSCCTDFNPRSPRGERRFSGGGKYSADGYFNPRSPRGERQRLFFNPPNAALFQSTLPAGGATISNIYFFCICNNFNPRSPRGERLRLFRCSSRGQISIHAPRGGSDVIGKATTKTT